MVKRVTKVNGVIYLRTEVVGCYDGSVAGTPAEFGVTMQHIYGYMYKYQKDIDTQICHFSKKTSGTRICFNYF
jgi:hypothetical protein